jgi:hypothetical protein
MTNNAFPIRRAKQQSIKMDCGDLVKQIHDCGVPFAQIAEFTGINLSVLYAIANDLKPGNTEWDKGVSLTVLWVMVRDESNIRKPVIGAQL